MIDIEDVFIKVKDASRSILRLGVDRINEVILAVADEVVKDSDAILEANAEDLSRMSPDDPKYDRLRLTRGRIEDIAGDMRNVSRLSSPVGKVLASSVLPNGLQLSRVAVPFGVIGVVYEARPNVTLDVFSLCLKAGSACVLKGGSDASCSNSAIVATVHKVLDRYNISRDIVRLLPSDRGATAALLTARGYVDLIIPRGSSVLINYVRENATIPVIETGAGVCHAYYDAAADLKKGVDVICNAKTRRVSVCNALDCLLVHRDRIADLQQIAVPLCAKGVKIFADESSYKVLQGCYPSELLFVADESNYGTEYLSYAMAVKCVDNHNEAIAHITRYGSGHSECIISEDDAVAEEFLLMVDAACVYKNAPTSFTDGAQFGLGAEIGISTQKLHARGPMALDEIVTYKWIVRGEGQVRK